jgi:integrase
VKNRFIPFLCFLKPDLKKIAETAKVEEFDITTYVSRHTWATIMKYSGVSTAVISEGMGHKSEKTTQIYLDSFANEVLDKANKNILK